MGVAQPDSFDLLTLGVFGSVFVYVWSCVAVHSC